MIIKTDFLPHTVSLNSMQVLIFSYLHTPGDLSDLVCGIIFTSAVLCMGIDMLLVLVLLLIWVLLKKYLFKEQSRQHERKVSKEKNVSYTQATDQSFLCKAFRVYSDVKIRITSKQMLQYLCSLQKKFTFFCYCEVTFMCKNYL